MTKRAALARYAFWAGKGGVGKTTCSAAAALMAAESRGERVLLVSTDPAHSLGDALGIELGARATRVATKRGSLDAIELDADRALERWLGARRDALETVAERGTYLDRDDVEKLFGLSLPGVDELVGLLELARLGDQGRYDRVVVDTAPTGHTLRLLATPGTLRRIAEVLADMQAKHRLIAESLSGAYRSDATDEVIDEIDAQGEALEALLRDPARARVHEVLLPEVMAVEETRDAVTALERAGIAVDELVVNRVTPAPDGPCALCVPRVRAERGAIEALAAALPRAPVRFVAALEREPRGPGALRAVGRALEARDRGRALVSAPLPRAKRAANRARATGATDAWLERLAPVGTRLVLVGGKGGVGKTTCASTLALALARRAPSSRVLLLSTDPAPSIGDALGLRVGDRERSAPGAPAGLRVRELDADAVFRAQRERYRASVDELFDALRGGSRFDAAYDRAVVQDLIDLAPPGLDELFGVLAVLDALAPPPGRAPRFDALVVDTAPTGHALRLLELPSNALEWVHALIAILLKYRSVVGLGDLAKELLETAHQLRALIALLADPTRARFVAVARAAELPRVETARLLRALDRLHVAVPVVVVNAVTPADGCDRCRRIARAEGAQLDALARACRSRRSRPCAIITTPALAPPPRGVASLSGFGERWTTVSAPAPHPSTDEPAEHASKARTTARRRASRTSPRRRR